MGMTGSDSIHGVSGINVTPLIDVLLVLLVIFMLIVPVTPRGLSSAAPQPARHSSPREDTIVVQVDPGPDGTLQYRINQTPLPKAELQGRLTGIFAARQQKVMFVKADPAIEYAGVSEVVDIAHRASVETVGLLTPGLERAR